MVEASRRAQGLAPKVTDAVALTQVATILRRAASDRPLTEGGDRRGPDAA